MKAMCSQVLCHHYATSCTTVRHRTVTSHIHRRTVTSHIHRRTVTSHIHHRTITNPSLLCQSPYTNISGWWTLLLRVRARPAVSLNGLTLSFIVSLSEPPHYGFPQRHKNFGNHSHTFKADIGLLIFAWIFGTYWPKMEVPGENGKFCTNALYKRTLTLRLTWLSLWTCVL